MSQGVFAQIHFGLNSNLALPTKKFTEVDFGAGGDVYVGYSFKQRADVQVSVGNNWFISILGTYQIRSYTVGTNYYFIDKAVRPYIGVYGGYYIKSFDGVLDVDKFYQKAFGIKPQIGCLFDIETMQRLKVNAQFYYNKVFTKNEINLYGFTLGLVYYFSKPQ